MLDSHCSYPRLEEVRRKLFLAALSTLAVTQAPLHADASPVVPGAARSQGQTISHSSAGANPQMRSQSAADSNPRARSQGAVQNNQLQAAAELWEKLQKEGTEATDTGRYGEAERMLRKAVIKSAAFGEGDLRFAKSLGELGRLLTIRGRFQEAEPLLEEELHNKEIAMNKENGEIIPSMGSLITFYLEDGTASKADPLTERMLEFVEGKLNDYRTGTQGPVTLKAGQPLQAWAGTAALTMRDPVIEWAITCDAIGNLYFKRKNYDMAERLFKAAMDVKETVLGKQHLSLANSYDSLGSICMERNQEAEAESYFRSAFENTDRILDQSDPQVFNRLDKLAKCLIKEGKFEEAEQLYVRAQDFWKNSPSRAGTEARAAYALGNLYVIEKKYNEAEPILQRALQLAEQFYGPSSMSLVPFIRRYADTMYYLGRKDELNQLRGEADTIAGTDVVTH